MKYLSATELGEKWNLSSSQIRKLAAKGKIPGAKFVGSSWIFPEDATKISKDNYKFPLLYLNEETQTFSEDEKKLLKGQMLCLNCKFEETKEILEKLLQQTKYTYIEVGCIYTLFFTYLYTGEHEKAQKLVASLKILFKTDFKHKTELILLYNDLINNYDNKDVELNNFAFDSTYNYSSTAQCFIIMNQTYKDITDAIIKQKQISTKIYEIICRKLETEKLYVPLMYMYFYIGFMYQYANNLTEAKKYYKKTIELSIEKTIYTPLLGITLAMFEQYKNILQDFPEEIRTFFNENHTLFRNNYFSFIDKIGRSSYNSKLTDEDLKYINYVVSNIPNKKIEEIENLSESTVNKKYLAIYQKLGISGKKELYNIAIAVLKVTKHKAASTEAALY